jgi:hypothetical protein
MLIGDIEFGSKSFRDIETVISKFSTPQFQESTSIERNSAVNRTLLELIESEPRHSFLLREVIDYAQRVTDQHVLDGNYNLTAFERWLNQHAELSNEEQRVIRGKIIGKYVPRDEYQIFFPIGHDKYYPHSHYVTAHNPPDLDSTTGSFIGWMDAFGCKVGNTLTVWNVPQGEPSPLISHYFNLIFTPKVFTRIAKNKVVISPVAMDIVNQERLHRVACSSDIRDFQHNRNTTHIIVVDDDGFFLGDWRISDVDSVGRIQRLLNMSIHSYEKLIISSYTELMSHDSITKEDCELFLNSVFNCKIGNPKLRFQRYNITDQESLDKYLRIVLKLENGSDTSFIEFFRYMDKISKSIYGQFIDTIKLMLAPENFCPDTGKLTLSRAHIFNLFHQSYSKLTESIQLGRDYYDRMDVALAVKKDILGHTLNYVSTKAEPTEILQKLRGYQHITVCFPDKKGRLIPVGVIHRNDLHKDSLGTVTLRDFCNNDEIKLAKDVRVISAIDHHRSEMNSRECMTITIADVQSVNVLLAEKAFIINDLYSNCNQSLHSIDEQIKSIQSNDKHLEPTELRQLARLMQKKQAIYRSGSKYFIHPEREIIEYTLMLNAIVDDTDLFNKCGWRDLKAIADVVNRMKSIICGREMEILSLEPYNKNSKSDLRKAINDFLNNEDIVSFYKNIFEHRRLMIDEWMKNPSQHGYCFEDRKIQNEFCAVSQLKLFPENKKSFIKHRSELLDDWIASNQLVKRKTSVVDFFLQMNSTIQINSTDSDDTTETYDELWFNIDDQSEQGASRLRQFFDALVQSDKYPDFIIQARVEGPDNATNKLLSAIVENNLKISPVSIKTENAEPIICLRIKTSSMNSRKADITPYLPK